MADVAEIHCNDPPEVFHQVATLLTVYSAHIGRDVDEIVVEFSDREAAAAARAYVRKVGGHIPDPIIRGAVVVDEEPIGAVPGIGPDWRKPAE
jgi:hypothetical protein